jgi:hypothetical protein
MNLTKIAKGFGWILPCFGGSLREDHTTICAFLTSTLLIRQSLSPTYGHGTESIGPGDEVYIVGLFSRLTGKKTNLSVVRTGNIAMLSTELVPVERYPKSHVIRDTEAYLIEARSIGRLSGSPIFVRPTVRSPDGELRAGGLRLLGLVHRHWDITPGMVVDVLQSAEDDESSEIDAVNVGIALVVPMTKIWEVLHRKDVLGGRAREDRDRDWANTPTQDHILPHENMLT